MLDPAVINNMLVSVLPCISFHLKNLIYHWRGESSSQALHSAMLYFVSESTRALHNVISSDITDLFRSRMRFV